jgi:transcriptional regulator with GAF, ATPase, and Fis domain
VRFERETIQTALTRHPGSLESAAVELGLPVSNLRYKMSRLDLPLDGAVDGDPI